MILDEKTKKILKVYGTDAEVMYLLRDKMNFTMILQEPDKNYFGLKLPNGSFIGGIGLLIRNETDIVITGYFIKDYNTRDVEYTVEILQIYVDTWIIWVRVGLIKLPKYKSGRIFLLSVSIVSVIFGAIFESSLATVYTKPLFYPDINTLQQLAKKGYKILYKYESMKDDLFPKNVSATYDYLDSKMTLSNKNVSLVKSMVEKKNFASVNRWLGLQLQDSNYFTRKVLHVIPECPKLYMLSYVLQKNSPYAERINNLLLEFLASGLLNYWTNQRKLKEYLAHLKEPLNENNFAKITSTLHYTASSVTELSIYPDIFVQHIFSSLTLLHISVFRNQNYVLPLWNIEILPL
ncbi:uncharacterized protein LOC129618941 [Condylostylus longicornis]|uniref:uncharacterized protein LOC129618941 n=1 Tax=Condylostylus longicornis TaxID=2530218 RepID=UPI00244E286C|nr:uncharacterized protein LOC129618941 [Condylostylus longicornis]